ncbi:MAG: aromatic amino acid lyase [Deltaproteobacteria bacterium]|nr:aromatic amino acid lyase [Deltaproteobacteria bacterium]
MSDEVAIDGKNLTLEEVRRVANERASVYVASDAKEKMNASRRVVEKMMKRGDTVYGVNTGFDFWQTFASNKKRSTSCN